MRLLCPPWRSWLPAFFSPLIANYIYIRWETEGGRLVCTSWKSLWRLKCLLKIWKCGCVETFRKENRESISRTSVLILILSKNRLCNFLLKSKKEKLIRLSLLKNRDSCTFTLEKYKTSKETILFINNISTISPPARPDSILNTRACKQSSIIFQEIPRNTRCFPPFQ